VLHTGSIDTKDHIAAGMRLILYGVDILYVVNTMDGSVEELTTTLHGTAGLEYVSDLCGAILHVEQDLPDAIFVARYGVKLLR
jgi:hypothetical protein